MPDNNNYSDECDCNALKNKIKAVLRRYFEVNDNGDPNPEFDDSFEPQAVIDEIHEIVGDI